MSNHEKKTPGRRATGPVDRDRDSAKTKMNREMRNTDEPEVNDSDLRGRGREAVEQQRREPPTRDPRSFRRGVN
jgi:hypothetical protein